MIAKSSFPLFSLKMRTVCCCFNSCHGQSQQQISIIQSSRTTSLQFATNNISPKNRRIPGKIPATLELDKMVQPSASILMTPNLSSKREFISDYKFHLNLPLQWTKTLKAKWGFAMDTSNSRSAVVLSRTLLYSCDLNTKGRTAICNFNQHVRYINRQLIVDRFPIAVTMNWEKQKSVIVTLNIDFTEKSKQTWSDLGNCWHIIFSATNVSVGKVQSAHKQRSWTSLRMNQSWRKS